MEEYKKKYEEAMLRMNKWVEGSEIIDPKEVAEFVFPELKESEDENIRKSIIGFLKTIASLKDGKTVSNKDFDSEALLEWAAWLEKQGEKNLSTDFSDLRTWKYIVDAVWTEKEGIGQYLDSPFTEETAKKLQKRFGNIEQKPAFCHHEVDFSGCSEEYRKAYYDGWNNCNQQHDQLEAEQKPAWSEEDENYCLDVNAAVSDYFDEGYAEELKDWLKSLKERIKGE